jgi:hypothetical protein
VKKAIFTFISIAAFIYASGQSKMIEEVFRLLPADKIFGLTAGTRDSMLKGKTYYPADNDSNSIEAYNYGISTNVKNYMYVSMDYETAQRASGMIEIRSFKTIKGENLIVVSQTSGVWPINYQQNDLSFFIYNGSKKLIPYKKILLPPADETIFIKSGIPDSIRQKILNNSNITFDFSTAKPTLELNSNYLTNDAFIEKWLKGDFVEFAWSGGRFIATKINFKK